MKCMLVVSCLVALAAATPGYLGAGPLGYSAAHLGYSAATPLAYSAVVAPAAVTSQHHAQDTLGQYSYGYQGDTSAKEEVRTADGITRGGYSYLDANGLVQSASYVSDPFNGFRVAATNLPQGPVAPAYAAAPALAAYAAPVAVAAGVPLDTPEVAAAKAAHFQAHHDAKAQLLGRKKRSPGFLNAAPVAAYAAVAPAATFGYSSVSAHPATVAVAHAAPVAVAHAIAPAATFGYSSVSAHPATVAIAHAAPIAVAHAPLALAPSTSLVDPVAIAAGAPLPVADTIEVAAARAAHFNAHAAAKAQLFGRKKRSPGFLNAAPLAVAHASPLAYAASPLAYAHSSPLAYAHASPLAYAHAAPILAHGYY